VYCWAENKENQLGYALAATSSLVNIDLDTPLANLVDVASISVGPFHTCAVSTAGSAKCWGDHTQGKLGYFGLSARLLEPPVATIDFSGRLVAKISAGRAHTCAVFTDGTAACWGSQANGRLGNGATTGVLEEPPSGSISFPSGAGITVQQIEAGYQSTCAVMSDGNVFCMGSQNLNRLPMTATSGTFSSPQATLLGPAAGHAAVSKISLGKYQLALSSSETDNQRIVSCAVHTDGTLSCWGSATVGQMGVPSVPNYANNVPYRAYNFNSELVVDVSVGLEHTCAVMSVGSVWCWGKDSSSFNIGRLGLQLSSSTAPAKTWQVLRVPQKATRISVGSLVSCALLEGALRCWGSVGGSGGGRSQSEGFQFPTAAVLAGEPTFEFTGFGMAYGSAAAFGISQDGRIFAWGSGSYSLTSSSDATDGIFELTSDLATGRTATDISCGMRYCCIVLDNGSVTCWGEGSAALGQGNSASDTRPFPTPFTPAAGAATSISAHRYAAVTLTSGGKLVSWGEASAGERLLGQSCGTSCGSRGNPHQVDHEVDVAGMFVQAVAGMKHMCAISSSSALLCWGSASNGALGNGQTSGEYAPTTIAVGGTTTQVCADDGVTCVVLSGGDVKCWGRQQVAGGSQLSSPPSSTITPAGIDAVSVQCAHTFACFLTTADEHYCWGTGSNVGLSGYPSAPQNTGRTGIDKWHLNQMGTIYTLQDGTVGVEPKSSSAHPALGAPAVMPPLYPSQFSCSGLQLPGDELVLEKCYAIDACINAPASAPEFAGKKIVSVASAAFSDFSDGSGLISLDLSGHNIARFPSGLFQPSQLTANTAIDVSGNSGTDSSTCPGLFDDIVQVAFPVPSFCLESVYQAFAVHPAVVGAGGGDVATVTIQGYLDESPVFMDATRVSVDFGPRPCLVQSFSVRTAKTPSAPGQYDINCTAPANVGGSVPISVNITGAVNTLALHLVMSYARPAVLSLALLSGDTVMDVTGGQQLLITGKHFGLPSEPISLYSVQVQIPDGTWANCTDLQHSSDTSLTCITPASWANGSAPQLVVTVAGQEGTASMLPLLYGRPAVHSIACVTDSASLDTCSNNAAVDADGSGVFVESAHFSTTGALGSAQRTMLFGQHFSPLAFERDPTLVQVELFHTQAGSVACGTVDVLNSTHAFCSWPAGEGRNWDVRLSVAGLSDNPAAAAFDYFPPSNASFVDARRLNQTGGNAVIIRAGNLGHLATLPTVKFGHQNCSNVQRVALDIITCTSPPGAKAQQQVTVAVAGQVSTNLDEAPRDGAPDSLTASYASLEFQSVLIQAPDSSSRPALLVAGLASAAVADSVTVTVLNGGPPDLPITRSMWVAGVPCHVHGSLTFGYDVSASGAVQGRFQCTGLRAADLNADNATVVIQVEDQLITEPIGMLGQPSFNTSSFAQLSGSRVRFTGANFGRAAYDLPTVHIGAQPCTEVQLESPQAVTCVVPPGHGLGHAVVITNALGLASAPQAAVFNYTLAVHSMSMLADEVVDDANGRRPFLLGAATSGTVYSLRVLGASFGTLDAHVQSVAILGAQCGSVTVVSSQELICQALPAEDLVRSAPVVLVVMASGQSLTVGSGLLSFMDAPSVVSISAQTGDTSDTIRVFGTQFGRRTDDLADVQIAGRSCFAFSRVSQTECTCIVPQGTAKNGSVSVILSTGLSGILPYVFTYALRLTFARTNKYNTLEEPLVFMGAVATPPAATVFVPLTHRVTVEGVNFGAGRSDLRELWVAGARCPDAELQWQSNTRLVCAALPAHAVQNGHSSVVFLALNDTGGNSAALTADGANVVYSVVPAPTVQLPQRAYEPAETLVVSGSNFLTDDVDDVAVFIGTQECTGAEATSRLTIRCTVPAAGLGALHDLQVVTAGGLRSDPNAFFSYRHEVFDAWLTGATLSDAVPQLLQSTSGSSQAAARTYDVSVSGFFLGNSSDVAQLLIGGATCPAAAVSKPSQNVVRCSALPAAALVSSDSEVQVTLAVGGQTAVAAGAVQVMGQPVVSPSLQLLGSAGAPILMVGSNFGWSAAQLTSASIGGTACTALTWISSTSIECVVPSGSGLALPVTVTTAGGLASVPVNTFSYENDIPLTPPANPPGSVTGVREVAEGGTVQLSWKYTVDPSPLRPTTRFVIFILLGDDSANFAANNALRRLQDSSDTLLLRSVSVLLSDTSALTRTDLPDGSSVFSADVIGLESRPYLFRVAAANGGGEGPASDVSAAVFEACESTAYLSNAPVTQFSDIKCEPCPEGAFCGGGEYSEILPLQGFFRLPWSRNPVFRACPVQAACQGYDSAALGSNNLASANLTAALRSQLASGEQCAVGHRGLFCQQCERGFTDDGQGLCQPCSGPVEATFALVGGVMALLLMIVYLVYTNLKPSSSHRAALRSSLQKVLLGHIQTVALALSFNLKWPSAIQVTLDSMSFATSVGGNLVSVQCLLDVDPSSEQLVTPYRAQVLFDFALPLLLGGIFCGLWLLDYKLRLLDRCRGASKCRTTPPPGHSPDVAQESEEEECTANSLAVCSESKAAAAATSCVSVSTDLNSGAPLPSKALPASAAGVAKMRSGTSLDPGSDASTSMCSTPPATRVAAWSDEGVAILDDTAGTKLAPLKGESDVETGDADGHNDAVASSVGLQASPRLGIVAETDVAAGHPESPIRGDLPTESGEGRGSAPEDDTAPLQQPSSAVVLYVNPSKGPPPMSR